MRKKRLLGRFNLTFTTKITIIYGSLFALAILIASFFLFSNAYLYYNNLNRAELAQAADEVEELLHSSLPLDQELLKETFPSRSISVKVIDVNNETEIISQGDASFLEPRPQGERDPFFRHDYRFSFINMVGKRGFSFYERFCEYEEQPYIIQAAKPFDRERQALRLFVLVFIIFNVIGSFFAFIMGKYIAKRMLRPIIQITETAERISIEDLTQRIEINGPDDEIHQLSRTFNDMISRLEISFQQQNQFMSDASHELRTPISVIQGYASLIDRWGKDDPAILQESIDSIKAETQHMSMLIKKLLFLAKGDYNKKHLHIHPLTLAEVATEVKRELDVTEESSHTGHTIQVVEYSEGLISGDYDLIKQMLWIFIENSMKYCQKQDQTIQITIGESKQYCYLTVQDEGLGIAEEDLPNIFKRFYRGDKSRSKEIPGTGLGLSIADWIIQQHSAEVEVDSTPGVGTRITIKFKPFERRD